MPLTLSGTNGVSGIDGSASTPSLRGTDTNTGIVFGSDTLSLATGGNSAALTVDANSNVTFPATTVMGSSFKRNRIINGDMRVDQRNAGAEVNPAAPGVYYLDRWFVSSAVTSKFKIGQNAGSVTPPVGFTKYLGITSLSSYTVGAGEYFMVAQAIEGFNIADLAWGTANAKTVTLSFQVYSSLTGTFGGVINNGAANRSYPFTYTISSANTWTSISITITGDTSGTWATDNTSGLVLRFGLGVGSTYSGTAGSWSGNLYFSATGATSVVGTNGATFYFTGVQLEVGSVATPYERQIYSDQLAQCQRYLYRPTIDSGTGNTWLVPQATFNGATAGFSGGNFPVMMRAQPTLTTETATLSNYAIYAPGASSYFPLTALSFNSVSSTTTFLLNFTIATGGTAGQSGYLVCNSTPNYSIRFSAEL